MASFKFGDDKIKVIFVVGSKTLHPGVIRKGVDFNISSNLNLDQKCFEALDVNYKIGTLKQTYFKKHSSFFFDGLLLEDEATLVGLGVVEGDFIYVGDKGSFDDAFNSKTRVATEISVGLNVLIGETELGFDVIYKDSESVLDTMSIPDCCKIAILKTQDSFFQAFEQVLAEPQFKSLKIIPDLSQISTALNEKSYASATEVIMDFNLAIGIYMRSLPSWPIEHLGIKMCRRLHDEFKHCSYSCTINHRLTLPADVVFIGPARNSNFSNYLAYPPTVQLRGRKINKDTTLEDLVFSYQMYSEKENLNINWLSHDNVDFDLGEKVFDVLGLDWNTSYRKKHFFYFPFDITKSEDTRRIDDLVEFIEGDGDIQPSESKKKRKKKRKSNQSQSVVATAENLDNVTGTPDDLEKDKDEDAKSEDLARNEIYGAISQNVHSELDAKHCKLNHLSKEKLYLERASKEEHEHLVVHKQNVEDIIDSKSAEMKNLILMIEKSEDEKNDRLKEVNKIDIELSDLETKMAELKMKKTELLKAGSRDDELIQKFESKKHKLEGYIEKELKKAKEKGNSIEANIQDLEKKLSTTVKAIENLPNEVLTFPTIPPVEPNRQLLDFIDNQISEKEKELECPVCFEVAGAPIFMCSELHLICSNCRPKVKECPECRIQYEGKPKRHRYAEKTAEELVRLKSQRAQSEGSAL